MHMGEPDALNLNLTLYVQARSKLAVALGNISAKRRNKLALSINRSRTIDVHLPKASRKTTQPLSAASAGKPKKKKKKKVLSSAYLLLRRTRCESS